jgi:hypothetical protein
MNRIAIAVTIIGLGLAFLLSTVPAVAQQREYYLVAQWVGDYGQRFCRYSNGTVLNVGVNTCPLSIKAWM